MAPTRDLVLAQLAAGNTAPLSEPMTARMIAEDADLIRALPSLPGLTRDALSTRRFDPLTGPGDRAPAAEVDSWEADRRRFYEGARGRSREELVERANELVERMEELAGHPQMTRPQQAEFDRSDVELLSITEAVRRLDRETSDRDRTQSAAADLRSRGGVRGGNLRVDGPGGQAEQDSRGRRRRELDALSGGDRVRDDALRAMDREVSAGRLAARSAELVERLVTDGGAESATERAWAARWATVTSDPAYVRAFARLVADPVRGHLLWDGEEQQAFRDAEMLRAMSLTDAAGGYLVPTHLDPAILLSSAGSTDPLREISRVEVIAGDTWNGVTSAGVTAEWKAEAAEAADASPTLAPAPVPVWLGDAFTPYSYEIGGDAANLVEQLTGVLQDAATQHQAAAFWRGNGTSAPKGIVTALTAAGGSILVPTATADTLVAGDVTKLQEALPPRFQANATFTANLGTINAIGAMETTAGARRFPEVTDGRLLNRRLMEASSLDKAGATAAAGNDEVSIYGDFRQFLIVDRIGATLELIPNLVGANRRPTGQRGAMLWFRTGSDVLVSSAFRMLTA
jgi:HK97 family phage major capsid protein